MKLPGGDTHAATEMPLEDEEELFELDELLMLLDMLDALDELDELLDLELLELTDAEDELLLERDELALEIELATEL